MKINYQDYYWVAFFQENNQFFVIGPWGHGVLGLLAGASKSRSSPKFGNYEKISKKMFVNNNLQL